MQLGNARVGCRDLSSMTLEPSRLDPSGCFFRGERGGNCRIHARTSSAGICFNIWKAPILLALVLDIFWDAGGKRVFCLKGAFDGGLILVVSVINNNQEARYTICNPEILFFFPFKKRKKLC